MPMARGRLRDPQRVPTELPPPAASQPAIEGAQSADRPWITLRGATKT